MNPFQTYTKFAIGDIHGSMKYLQALVGKCLVYAEKQQTRPHFILLGDYVDRGPQSRQVLTYLQQLPEILGPGSKVTCVRGNHDQMFIDAILRHDVNSWFSSGGEVTLNSYARKPSSLRYDAAQGIYDPLMGEHAKWLDTLPLSFEDEYRFFCHAGIRPGVPLDRQEPYDLLWIRHEFLNSRREHPKLIVHGHSPTLSGPDLRTNRLNLDTGACMGGKLTAAVFNDTQAAPLEFLSAGPGD
jgi:serine/threonine protein phosphatase 1